MAEYHEVITYQILPANLADESKVTDLKKLYFLGPVYKSTLIDSAIEKGEFSLKDLKEHLAFTVHKQDDQKKYPF